MNEPAYIWPAAADDERRFALVDGGAATDLVARLRRDGFTLVPLWYGDVPPEAEATAPYLIPLDPGARADTLAREVIERSLGLLITAGVELEPLRRHLLRFAMGRDGGAWRLLRFDQPPRLRALMKSLPAEWLDVLFGDAVRTIACSGARHPAVLERFRWADGKLRHGFFHIHTGAGGEESAAPPPIPPPAAATPSAPPATGPPRGAFTLRPEQVEALRAAAERRWVGSPAGERVEFVVEIGEALRAWLAAVDRDQLERAIRSNLEAFHPGVVRAYTAPDLRHMIRFGMVRAEERGLRDPANILGWVKLMLLIAPDFDEHPKVRGILSAAGMSPDQAFERVAATMSESDWGEAQELYRLESWNLPELE